MFRELERKNKQISKEECVEILINEKRGVLSVAGDNGYPYGMPMNHFYCEEDGCVYFHSGNTGHRLDSIRKNDKVSFCVYDSGYKKEGQWSLNIKSVIIFGRMEIIDDKDEIVRIITPFCRKFTDDEEYIRKEIKGSLHRTLLLKLTPENICGKLVNES